MKIIRTLLAVTLLAGALAVSASSARADWADEYPNTYSIYQPSDGLSDAAIF